jgi:hypothetical protein
MFRRAEHWTNKHAHTKSAAVMELLTVMQSEEVNWIKWILDESKCGTLLDDNTGTGRGNEYFEIWEGYKA